MKMNKSKVKKIVLFSGLGAILLAIIIITSVSLIQYKLYRNRVDKNQTEISEVLTV